LGKREDNGALEEPMVYLIAVSFIMLLYLTLCRLWREQEEADRRYIQRMKEDIDNDPQGDIRAY
jgi:hypothetical protein